MEGKMELDASHPSANMSAYQCTLHSHVHFNPLQRGHSPASSPSSEGEGADPKRVDCRENNAPVELFWMF